MAKPPTSVRSVRLSDTLWAEITAKAEGEGFTVNGFIAMHMNVVLHPEVKHFVVRSGPASQQAEAANAERDRNGDIYRRLVAPGPRGKNK